MAEPVVAAGEENRLRILRAAEQLMAERGIDGVSLREINKAAGQGNASAIQYHFGDRNGLLMAILDRHQAQTDPRRHAMLDEWEHVGGTSSDADARSLADALVVPFAEKLTDPDGGRAYVQVAAEFYARARTIDDLGDNADPRHSMSRWHVLVAQRFPEGARTRFPPQDAAVRLMLGEVARRAQGPPARSERAFTEALATMIAALLEVPAH